MDRNSGDGFRELARILARVEDERVMTDFLECLLTEREISDLSLRWELVKLLDLGISQRKIARELNVSLCKITRGSRELKKPSSPLKLVLRRYAGTEKETVKNR